jgi:lipopolysaccharide/colanic/teichoic acid biosynthesis glycosyltransferase
MSRAGSALKRACDFVVALVALVLLWPVLLLIALWIKCDSPGPVFFRQVRVGRHGRHFRIWKFRTMSSGAEARGQITVGADPRVTRAGRTLRRLKLDELPQLFNVLAGDMSLVGPRPEVVRYVEMYPPQLRDKVLSIRPGITAPTALHFYDEAAMLAAASDPEREYVEKILPAKLAAYVEYVENATLADDARTIVQTAAAIARRVLLRR